MANSLTALNAEKWSKELQIEREKRSVVFQIANTAEKMGLMAGDTVNRPYLNKFFAQDYTKGSDLTMADITSTNEQLTIDTIKAVPVYIDQVDAVQNSYSARQKLTGRFMADLVRQMDASVLAEYSNANTSVDASDFGGTASVGVTVDSSNVTQLFAKAAKKLDNRFIDPMNRFAVITPSVAESLRLYAGGKDTQFGDQVLLKDPVASIFGFQVFVSTNTTVTARWTPADQPSDGSTITINGVVFTFETGALDAAGKVLVEVNTATTIDNLVLALASPGVTTTKHYAVSYDDQRLLEGITGTDGTTYLDITLPGGGEATLATSEVADPWTRHATHCLFGQKGATDLVVQAQPQIGFNLEPKRLPGSGNLIAWDLYGKKTFTDMKDALCNVLVALS